MRIRIPLGGGGPVEWQKGRPEAGGFSIEMPGGVKARKVPLFKFKDKRQGKLPMYTQVFSGQSSGDGLSEYRAIAIMYSYIPYPPPGDAAELAERWNELVGAQKAAVKNLLEETSVELHGYRGQQLRSESQGKTIVVSRSFVFPRLFISLSFHYNKNTPAVPEGMMQHFFDSLEVDADIAPRITAAASAPAPPSASPAAAAATSAGPVATSISISAPGTMIGGPSAPASSAKEAAPPTPSNVATGSVAAPTRSGSGAASSASGSAAPTPGPRMMPPPRAVPPEPAGQRLVDPQQVDQAWLVQLFSEAQLQASVTAEGYLLAEQGQYFCYAWPTEGAQSIKLFTPFAAAPGAEQLALLDFVNLVNCQLEGIRAAVADDLSLRFDREIPVAGGVTRELIVAGARDFFQKLGHALALDGGKVLYIG